MSSMPATEAERDERREEKRTGSGQYVKMGRVPVGGDAPHKDTAI